MAEQKKPIDSVPPPTDEIDGEWNEAEAPAAKATAAAAPSRTKATASRNEEEEEEEDDEEEEEEEDDEDDDEDDTEDGEEEDDEDEEDDEEEDDEEEEAGVTSSERSSSSSGPQDWLPDWAPWATLGGLLLLGLVGGLGLLPIDGNLEKEPEPAASAVATTSATVTSTAAASARRRPPAAANSAEQGEAISAAHILIAYQGAMRANPKVTRTKEEAKKLAEQVDKKAKSGTDFKELVKEYSDEPRAAERGGELGSFTRNRMVKPFSDAAFQLKVGQISDVVETQFGYHVIKRTK
jgi:parvulin-like peptidyl-prolyl isomerase